MSEKRGFLDEDGYFSDEDIKTNLKDPSKQIIIDTDGIYFMEDSQEESDGEDDLQTKEDILGFKIGDLATHITLKLEDYTREICIPVFDKVSFRSFDIQNLLRNYLK